MDAKQPFNKSLFEICQAMVSSLELREVLDTILELTLSTLSANAGSILLFEPGSDNLKMLAARGLPPNVIRRGHIQRKGSIAEWVIQNNKPLIINKISDVFPDVPANPLAGEDAIKTAMSAPLQAHGETIGALNINRYDPANVPFLEEDLQVLVILASQAAVCIENARLHEQILEKTRMAAIGQTVAGISHCVKNMLTGLRGSMGILEIALKDQNWPTVEKASGFLRTNIERISLLVLDMLDYSHEKTPLKREASLDKIVQEVFDIARYKTEKKAIELRKEIAPECAAIFADPDQIFRCLLNLVENAADAHPKEGYIAVKCAALPPEEAATLFPDATSRANMVRITVEDNAGGIAPEHLTSIFLPFFSTKASKGTGLGLAVTKKITEEHGGIIRVDSTLGKGTAFHLILPEKTADKSSVEIPGRPGGKPS